MSGSGSDQQAMLRSLLLQQLMSNDQPATTTTRNTPQPQPQPQHMIASQYEIEFVPKLTGAGDFSDWDFYVRILLAAKGLAGIVGFGSWSNVGLGAEWELLDGQAKYILHRTIEADILHMFRYDPKFSQTAEDMYKTLCRTYGPGYIRTLSGVQKSLF